MMKLTTSHMGLIERGERGVTAISLSRLSKILDIPVDKLFVGPNKKDKYSTDAQASRKKIQSLTTNLTDTELEFIIHTIKGVALMNHRL